MKYSSMTRRRFLLVGTACAGAMELVAARSGMGASPLPKLDPTDPLAAALSYVHDATQSARVTDTETCGVCLQFTGDATAEWGPCNLFQGKVVSTNGWCSGFVRKT